MAEIVMETARRHGVKVADIIGPSRCQPIARIRQETMFEVYVNCEHISFPMLGSYLGGRDHTTILHGVKKHCERNGLSYDTVRRAFPRGIGPAANTFTAQDYRDMARVA